MVLESDHAESVLTVISVHRLFGCWFKCYIVVLESDHAESVLTGHRLFGVWFKCYIVVLESDHAESVLTVISVHRLVFDSSFTLE